MVKHMRGEGGNWEEILETVILGRCSLPTQISPTPLASMAIQ